MQSFSIRHLLTSSLFAAQIALFTCVGISQEIEIETYTQIFDSANEDESFDRGRAGHICIDAVPKNGNPAVDHEFVIGRTGTGPQQQSLCNRPNEVILLSYIKKNISLIDAGISTMGPTMGQVGFDFNPQCVLNFGPDQPAQTELIRDLSVSSCGEFVVGCGTYAADATLFCELDDNVFGTKTVVNWPFFFVYYFDHQDCTPNDGNTGPLEDWRNIFVRLEIPPCPGDQANTSFPLQGSPVDIELLNNDCDNDECEAVIAFAPITENLNEDPEDSTLVKITFTKGSSKKDPADIVQPIIQRSYNNQQGRNLSLVDVEITNDDTIFVLGDYTDSIVPDLVRPALLKLNSDLDVALSVPASIELFSEESTSPISLDAKTLTFDTQNNALLATAQTIDDNIVDPLILATSVSLGLETNWSMEYAAEFNGHESTVYLPDELRFLIHCTVSPEISEGGGTVSEPHNALMSISAEDGTLFELSFLNEEHVQANSPATNSTLTYSPITGFVGLALHERIVPAGLPTGPGPRNLDFFHTRRFDFNGCVSPDCTQQLVAITREPAGNIGSGFMSDMLPIGYKNLDLVAFVDVYEETEELCASDALEETDVTVFRGIETTAIDDGTLLCYSDDLHRTFNPGFVLNDTEAPVWIVFEENVGDVDSLLVRVESFADTPGISKELELYDFTTSKYVVVDMAPESFNEDSVWEYVIQPDVINSFLDANGTVRARIGWRQTGFTILFPWEISVDELAFEVVE